MAFEFNNEQVTEALENGNFTIIDVINDPEEPLKTGFIIIHDLHPEEEVRILLTTKQENGVETSHMEFHGPD